MCRSGAVVAICSGFAERGGGGVAVAAIAFVVVAGEVVSAAAGRDVVSTNGSVVGRRRLRGLRVFVSLIKFF